MCGIAGIYLKDMNNKFLSDEEMEKLVDALIVGIEPRGDHASGIATMDKHGIVQLEKSDTPASNFILWRREVMPEAQTILLHTRFATKGSPMNLLNNHPIENGNSIG